MSRPTGPRADYREAASGSGAAAGSDGRPPARPPQPRQDTEPEEPPKRSRLVPLLLGVAALIVVGAVATYFITNGSKPSGGTTTPATTKPTSAAPSATPTPTPTPTPTKSTPAPVLGVWALTGMPRSTQETPVLCIKIENSVEARPQVGLDMADIVYEEVVEGGITRYMAVFQSQTPAKVEPVRSLRPMDVNLALPIGCPLIFSGGQAPFVNAAAATGIQLIYMDRGDPGFSRDSAKQAPHNVIGDTATFASQVKSPKAATPAFKYATAGQSTAATGGKATKTVSVKMSSSSNPQWTWDATKSAWMRSEGTKPAVVASGAQMSAQNVVVLSVKVENTKFKDPIGTPVPESIVIGNGTGVVASNGKSETIKWSKASATAPFVLTDSKGAPVTLEPGITWVELAPTTGSVTTA